MKFEIIKKQLCPRTKELGFIHGYFSIEDEIPPFSVQCIYSVEGNLHV